VLSARRPLCFRQDAFEVCSFTLQLSQKRVKLCELLLDPCQKVRFAGAPVLWEVNVSSNLLQLEAQRSSTVDKDKSLQRPLVVIPVGFGIVKTHTSSTFTCGR
jgi:hypothetical protein